MYIYILKNYIHDFTNKKKTSLKRRGSLGYETSSDNEESLQEETQNTLIINHFIF